MIRGQPNDTARLRPDQAAVTSATDSALASLGLFGRAIALPIGAARRSDDLSPAASAASVSARPKPGVAPVISQTRPAGRALPLAAISSHLPITKPSVQGTCCAICASVFLRAGLGRCWV